MACLVSCNLFTYKDMLHFDVWLFWEQLSGATVKLIQDGADGSEKIIQISGTPDQAEKAQSLLQGFILSSK